MPLGCVSHPLVVLKPVHQWLLGEGARCWPEPLCLCLCCNGYELGSWACVLSSTSAETSVSDTALPSCLNYSFFSITSFYKYFKSILMHYS